MKKICYVTTVPTTMEAFVLPIIERLTEKVDWGITLVSDADDLFAKRLPVGVRYIPVRMKRGISLSGIGAMLKMVRIFRQEKFDLVQYSTPNASLYASLAAKIAGIPVRLYCQWGIAYVGFCGMKRKIFKAIEKLVCSLSTWIEPDSYGNLEFSRGEGLYSHGKSSVVWNGSASGVDLRKFDIAKKGQWRSATRGQCGLEEAAFVYGFAGRITGDKGINELLSAFRRMAKEKPDVRLLLVGNVEKPESMDKKLFDWAQKEERILFCDYTDVVEQYLSAMDVFLLPSYREGFGSTVIEAEAMGVPVIVTDIPGPTDAMAGDKTGLIVKKADVDSLYEGMLRLYEERDLLRAFGEEAYRFAVEKFEQGALADHILEDRKRLLSAAK